MSHGIVKGAIWLIVFGAIWLVPFLHVYRTGRFVEGVGLCWAMMILTFLAVPLLVHLLILPYDPELAQTLPEANTAAMTLGFGWITGTLVSGLAMAARTLNTRIRQKHQARR